MPIDKVFQINNTEYVMRKTLAQGFTLVELLIVIALLGVIATIVIAAINPIEQANRASDAGLKADASQLVSALQRYYASHNAYPWMQASCSLNNGTFCAPEGGADAEVKWLSADDPSIGLCGDANPKCRSTANLGELVASQELQNQFLSKSWINPATETPPYQLLVGKGASASDAIYVCWTPKSVSNRQKLIDSLNAANKMVDTTAEFQPSGAPTAGTCATISTTDSPGWGTGACEECVPE